MKTSSALFALPFLLSAMASIATATAFVPPVPVNSHAVQRETPRRTKARSLGNENDVDDPFRPDAQRQQQQQQQRQQQRQQQKLEPKDSRRRKTLFDLAAANALPFFGKKAREAEAAEVATSEVEGPIADFPMRR